MKKAVPHLQVIDLVEYRNRATVAVLRYLAELAEKGEVSGLAVCVLYSSGSQHSTLTGDFERLPGLGLAAAIELYDRLAEVAKAR